MTNLIRASVGLGVGLALYACSSDNGGTADGAGAATGSGGHGTAGTGGVHLEGGPPPACNAGAACANGVCVAGTCCPTEQACSKLCCNDGEVCLFDQCIVPGQNCVSSSECGTGEYCEPALGSDNSSGGTGGTCSQAGRGKCVKLPPICGTPGASDAGCVQNCEYHPPTGTLHPVQKWQWGTDNPPSEFPDSPDVWSTPTVARVIDSNCDGKVDDGDPPNVIFVSGNLTDLNGMGNCACAGLGLNGKLRVLDGKTGKEVWSLDGVAGTSLGFAGVSTALGDIDGDGRVDIVAMTGDGHIAVIDADQKILGVSDLPVENHTPTDWFGWGGGIAIGDMDGDGAPELAYGRQVYTTKNGTITRLFLGTAGMGGGTSSHSLSFFADLNADGKLELVAGNTAYEMNGTPLWTNTSVLDGFNAVADFNLDQKPDVVVIGGGKLWILAGASGEIEVGPVTLPGTGQGGPPTIADFNQDGAPEIGVAEQTVYAVLKPDFSTKTANVLTKPGNHDLSSSVTGSSVFDFDGDGKAEVVYNDECFLWVWDGATGETLFATPTQSFTGTEASIVADVDGDGHAEIVTIANHADPIVWKCNVAPWNQADPSHNRPAWIPPPSGAYRGITVWGDRENSWVGTRSLWNQHAYSVSNVCDSHDDACPAPNVYGSIPAHQTPNWSLPWLNDFRQNVQQQGIFNAPDATVAIDVSCVSPIIVHVSVRNIGLAPLPAGVEADVFTEAGGSTPLGSVKTTKALQPGQTELLGLTVPTGAASLHDVFYAKIVIDPANKTFNECRDDNDESQHLKKDCGPA